MQTEPPQNSKRLISRTQPTQYKFPKPSAEWGGNALYNAWQFDPEAVGAPRPSAARMFLYPST